MADAEIGQTSKLAPSASLGKEEAYKMRPLADQESLSGSSIDSSDSAQVGVKRLEAVAATWSKWALIMAYAGYVLVLLWHLTIPLLTWIPTDHLQRLSNGICYFARGTGYRAVDALCN